MSQSVEPRTEIAHVLFLDLVGYSAQTTTTQARMVGELTSLVSAAPTYAAAQGRGQVLPLATGDGVALIFSQDVSLPARCAVELCQKLTEAGLSVRMGIHSGLVQRQTDIAGKENVAGEGINTAQRVMDLGDAGHILLSGQYAGWLKQFDEWAPHVRELGNGQAKHGLTIPVFSLQGAGFGRAEPPSKVGLSAGKPAAMPSLQALNVVILYKRKAQPDEQILHTLEARLAAVGHTVFIDRHLKIGVEWAKAIEEKIRAADAIVAIISDSALGSEMLEYELETAHDEFNRRGKPFIYPVRVGADGPVDGPIGRVINKLNFTQWTGPQDDARVVAELVSALAEPLRPKGEERQLEPVGGAVPPDSPFYVERDTDAEFMKALRANESIILVKGPRQMGKTSLIGRGAKVAKELGWRHAMTDFQKLSSAQLASDEAFYRLLAATLGRQLKFPYDFAGEWLDVFGANMNMDNYLRAVLEASEEPLVWFMDEADKLFGAPFSSDFFGLVRSWHNSRATEPDGPWSRLTIVIGYATEAHLFIQDLNQSPFNVGRQINLQSFTVEQVADLNERYGRPLKSLEEVRQVHTLVGGQPFLTRRALDVLSRGQMDLPTLVQQADRDEGPFGDHLKRILIAVSQMPAVVEALRSSLESADLKDTEGFHRLLAAGVVTQTADNKTAFRSELYRRYLGGHLKA